MADGNGAYRWEEDMSRRMAALEKAHKELEDSFIVMTHLETKMSQMLKQQAEYLSGHDQRLDQIDERIDKLVSAIGEFIRRLPPEKIQ